MAQLDLLEQVYLGNTEVISDLMNQQLSAQGFIVSVERQDDCMQIAITDMSRSLFGSQKTPNRKALGTMIQKWLLKIGVSNVSKIRVSLKKSQQSDPIWIDELPLVSLLSPDLLANSSTNLAAVSTPKGIAPPQKANLNSKIDSYKNFTTISRNGAHHSTNSEQVSDPKLVPSFSQSNDASIKLPSDAVTNASRHTASSRSNSISNQSSSLNGKAQQISTVDPLNRFTSLSQVGLLEKDLDKERSELDLPILPLPTLPPVNPLSVLGFHRNPSDRTIFHADSSYSSNPLNRSDALGLPNNVRNQSLASLGLLSWLMRSLTQTPRLPVQILHYCLACLFLVALIPSIHVLAGRSSVGKSSPPKLLWNTLNHNISVVSIPKPVGKHS
jgi:hypothetical protein